MKVRAIGLARFGLEGLPDGTPLSDLEARLLPLYLHHRYQLQAAVKTLGGVRYTYAVKEDGGAVRPSPVAAVEPADRQWQAMLAVLETLDPRTLTLPDRLLDLIPPQAFNRPEGTAERFQGRTGLVFDPVAASVAAADLAVAGLLNPQRAARLLEFHARDPKNPGFDQVVDVLVKTVWEQGPRQGRERAVERAVQWLVVNRLIGLASDDRADPRVRAVAVARAREDRQGRRARERGRRQRRLGHGPGDQALPQPPRRDPESRGAAAHPARRPDRRALRPSPALPEECQRDHGGR